MLIEWVLQEAPSLPSPPPQPDFPILSSSLRQEFCGTISKPGWTVQKTMACIHRAFCLLPLSISPQICRLKSTSFYMNYHVRSSHTLRPFGSSFVYCLNMFYETIKSTLELSQKRVHRSSVLHIAGRFIPSIKLLRSAFLLHQGSDVIWAVTLWEESIWAADDLTIWPIARYIFH